MSEERLKGACAYAAALLVFAGFGAVAYGLSLIYGPLSWLFAGAAMMLVGMAAVDKYA